MTIEKTALITAGGSGMGAGAAKRLAADGYKVGVLSSSGKGEALGEALGGFGVTGSNRSVADLARLVDGAMDRWGRVDVLVNSAGHGPKGDILEMTDEDWHDGLDVYLMNVIRMTRLVVPIMEKQGGGTIVNISTYAAFEPEEAFPTSGVFRAGLAAFTKLVTERLFVGIGQIVAAQTGVLQAGAAIDSVILGQSHQQLHADNAAAGGRIADRGVPDGPVTAGRHSVCCLLERLGWLITLLRQFSANQVSA